MKFVRVTRRWGKNNKYTEDYDGFIVEKTKEYVEIVGMGPDKSSKIATHSFDLDEVSIKSVSSERVQHFFRLAILKHNNEVNDAEFELLDARRSRDFAVEQFKKAFKRDPSKVTVEVES